MDRQQPSLEKSTSNGKNPPDSSQTLKSEEQLTRKIMYFFLTKNNLLELKEDGGHDACARMHRRSHKERVGLLANGE